ncbi:OmpA family protein [Pseudanabaena sp. FACHB-1998]|uniref:OmpA family protein n=1 Tax=Pseudanabaena sp. FACHB-1998 TaxID=2692858 RepID=UPI0016810E96|nr:OmpA family protein [Pseudanabaena sp. FACHB-1998]MBD2176557.1 OmpA family protein [Pseudanabaena sp. FACHB-1998]
MLQDGKSETNLDQDFLEQNLTKEIASKGCQMPANLVAAEFGEVNVLHDDTACQVSLTIAMEPQGRFAEGWRTGLALDASASMKRAYGRKVEARVDPELLTDYIKQGKLRSYMEDGEPIRKIEREAFAEIQERGYEVNYTENILQPLVQDFTAYLAGSLDGIGKTSLIYWGCGKGDEIQVLGEFDAANCQNLAIAGPSTFQLGKTTKLLPAIAYFVEQYRQAERGMYIFLTDGRIDDLEKVKQYTKDLALEIAAGKRNYLKLILIGIGKDVDRYQLQELDDFDTGLAIDLWDYKIASEMGNLTQIFAEVVNDNQIVAASGTIYDDAGNLVKTYRNGLPAKIDFAMKADAQWFELEVDNQRIRQPVRLDGTLAIAPLPKKNLFAFEIQAKESRNAELLTNLRKQSGTEVEATELPPAYSWKWLAALFVGAAFMGTMIAFAVLIQRSDNNRLLNPLTTNKEKDSEVKPIDNSNNLINSGNPTNSRLAPNSQSNSTNVNTDNPNNSQNNSNKSIDKNNVDKDNNIKTNITANKSTSNIVKSSNNLSGNIDSKSNQVGNERPNSISSEPKETPNFPLIISQKDAVNKQSDPKINNVVNPISDRLENISLNNLFEISAKVNIKINPNTISSNVGVSVVKSNSTNSLNSNSLPKQTVDSSDKIKTSILPIANPDLEVTIFFPSDDAQLIPTEESKIDSFWTKIQGRRGLIQVSGHTDKTGDYDYNLDLSQARANEVVRFLRDRGLDSNYKVVFEALSWLQPLRKNNNVTDNAFNRRVVLQFKEQR